MWGTGALLRAVPTRTRVPLGTARKIGQVLSMGSGAPLPTLQSIRTQRSVPAAGSERIPIPISIVPLHTIVPGRARLKIGGLRGAPDLAALLQRGLIGFGGVHGVLASALTGNITLRYEPTSSLDRLIEHIGGLLRGEVTPALHDPAERQWHASETQAIACELGTSCSHGFSATRAKEELARVGANTIPVPVARIGLTEHSHRKRRAAACQRAGRSPAALESRSQRA